MDYLPLNERLVGILVFVMDIFETIPDYSIRGGDLIFEIFSPKN